MKHVGSTLRANVRPGPPSRIGRAGVAPATLTCLFVALASGCGGDDDAPADSGAGRDGDGAPASPFVIPWLATGVPPIQLTPCPDGWGEVADGSGVTTCDPYPVGEPDCPSGEAWFPGEPGCQGVGPACPLDGLPEGLPADRPAVYVSADAPAGGDGSRASPYRSPADFSLAGLGRGTVLALGAGRYDLVLRLPAGLALWGACTADTVLTSSAPDPEEGVVSVVGDGVEIRALSIVDASRRGISVTSPGRSAALEAVVIEGAEGGGLLVAGGTLTARDLIVRETRPRAGDALFGRGLSLLLGGSVEITRGSFDRNHDVGLYAVDAGTTLRVEDTVVRQTRSQAADATGGLGLSAEYGAHVEAVRTLFEGNREVGASVIGTDTTFVLRDGVVRDNLARELDGELGRGLGLVGGAQASLTRVLFERNVELGMFAAQPGTTLVLEDAVVRETQPRARDGAFGRGLMVQDGARAEGTRVLVETSQEIAVFVSELDTVLVLADATIRDTRSRVGDGTHGVGLGAQYGAQVELSRLLIDRNRYLGLALLATATATVEDILVRDTLPEACVADSCADSAAGTGAVSVTGAMLSMQRFGVMGSALCGVQVARDAALDLIDGTVRDNPIGACIQIDAYDLARLTEGVTYIDNGTNLETTDLPVPEPFASGPLPGT